MTSYVYPSGCDGQAVSACHLNFLMSNVETTLENSVNISKLEYCNSLVDIEHDYLVIDVMTDSSGYNNTVCVADTTSDYYSSGLNGFYANKDFNTTLPVAATFSCSVSGCASVSCCDYCSYASASSGDATSGSAVLEICISDTDFLGTLSDFSEICFDVCLWNYVYSDNGCGLGCAVVCGGHDSGFVACRCYTSGGDHGNQVCCRCYCYCCSSLNCWDFYCNGVCKCQVTMSTFPSINLAVYGIDCCVSVGQASAEIQNLCATIPCSSKIVTDEVQFDNEIVSVYLTDENIGLGTVVYNVIDSTTSGCIACNVPVNCLYFLSCCVCCHIYEIVQCCDAVSCVRTYALAVGEAVV